MAASPAPNSRASLLAGLRTGGVRSVSGPVPHTASPAGTFNVPRYAPTISSDMLSPTEEDAELDADRARPLGPRCDELTGTPDPTARAPGVLHQAEALELGHQARDRGAHQARAGGQCRARLGPVREQPGEDEGEVGPPDVAVRARLALHA